MISLAYKDGAIKLMNKAFTYLAIILLTLSLVQFIGISVKAASPGPFWTWGGAGVPVKISNSENFDTINVGGAFFSTPNFDFYVATEGTNTLTWGVNDNGQLGNGNTTNVATPTVVPALANLKKVSTGWYSSLGIKNDGTVLVWGAGNPTPVQVDGLSNIVDVNMSGYGTGLALDSSGNVFSVGNLSNSAVLVPGLANIVDVSGGFAGKYALDKDGKVWAWGGNTYGQLGNGTLMDNPIPQIVQGLPPIKSISSGADSVMVLDVNGDVWAWGRASQNQIGQGETQPNQTTPLKVVGLPPIKEILSNGLSAKAIDFNQKVWEWGQNRTGGQSNIPANIPNPANPNLSMLADSATLQSNGRVTVAKRDLIVQAVLKIDQTTTVTSVSGGQSVTFTINYENTGPVTATGVSLSNDLLPDLSFSNCSNSCVNSGQNVTWSIPDIPAGGSGSVTLDVTVSNSVASGKLPNTTTISSVNAESNSATTVLDVLAPAVPGLNLTKSANQKTVSENSSFFYTLGYSNTLPSSVDNVIITDTLDSRLTISGLPGQCNNNNQDITCNLGTLLPGDSGTLEIYVNVISGAAGGPLANTAFIDSDQTEAQAVGNIITVNAPVINDPNTPQPLVLEKTVNSISSSIGDTLLYTIKIVNPNGDSVNLNIKDVLDSRLSYNFDSCNFGCNTSNSNINTALDWNFSISGNSTEFIYYSANINSNAAPGQLWNTVLVEYVESNNSNYSGSVASSVSTLINDNGQGFNPGSSLNGNFTVTKTATVSQVSPGDTFDYNIVVESQGYDGNIDFLDTLDPRLDLINCNICSQNGQQLTFNDYLSQNSTNNYTITVQVKNPAAGGALPNTAFVTRQSLGYGGSTETKASTAIVQIVVPQIITSLQISKTSSESLVKRGDSYVYTINYANIGNTNVTNATITDSLDSRLNFVSCSNSCSQTGQNLIWALGTLAAGDVGTVTVDVTVKNNAAPGILANTAQISSDQTTPTAGITYVRIEQPVPLVNTTINKTANKTTALPGEEIVYTINYANTGNVDLTNGVITDILNSNLSFVSCSSSCAQSGQTITWNLGAVAANTNTIVTVTVTVNSNTAAGILGNTASFKTNETPIANSTVNVNIGTITYTPLIVNKIASQSTVSQNTTYTYSINYQNPNSTQVTNAIITDTLDSRLDFVSCSNNCTQTGQNLTWNLGTLAGNSNGTLIITVSVKPAAASGLLLNTAILQSNETSAVSSTAQVTVAAPSALLPLNISKSSSQNDVNRNTTYTYSINYQNPNSNQVTNAVITDTLDSRLDFVSCSNSCSQTGQNLTWNLGTLNGNLSDLVTVTVKVKNQATYGLLANTVVADTDQTSAVSAVSFVSIRPINSVAAPTLTKTASITTTQRGESITYTINYSNNSDVNFSNAVLTDILDSRLTFVSCTGGCIQSGQNITWNIGNLNIGTSSSYSLTVDIKDNASLGLLSNIAELNTDESPQVQATAYVSLIINEVAASPSLNITKSASTSTVNRGDVFNYTLNYINGATSLNNVTISDTLDSRLDFVSCTASCTQSGQTITWNLGNLAANQTGSVNLVVQVRNNAAVGGIDNVATINSVETGVKNSNTVTVAMVVVQNPKLAITKSANNNSVAPGSNLIYTLNYSNTANLPVTNVVISDILDSRWSFVACSNACSQSGQTITWNLGNLALNESGSVTLEVNMSNSAQNGLVENTASISSAETTPNESKIGTAIVTAPVANISISNNPSQSTLYRSDTFTYSVSYVNGNLPVTNAVITDVLNSNLSFVSCTVSCSQSGQTITWNLGNLAANQTGSVNLVAQVRNNATLGGVSNTASVVTDQTSLVTASTNVAVIINDPIPVLSVSATTSLNTINPGDNISYSVSYSNPSDLDVTNAVISTVLDPGVTLLTPCTVICTQSGQTISWNLGNLASGASGSLSFEVQTGNSFAPGLLSNTLNITSTESIPNSITSSVAVIPVSSGPTASLNIQKIASTQTVNRGETFNYTLSYLNGDLTTTNAVISDVLDSRLSFVSCTASCTQSGQTITWNLGNLAANQTGSVNLVVQVRNNAALGNLDNTGSIISTQTQSRSSTVSVAIIINDPTPGLEIIKTASAQSLEPGSNVVYSINYTNPSPQNATNVTITDVLPTNLSFISCSGSCSQVGQTITWNIPALNSGESGTVSITALINQSTPNSLISNTAQIQSTGFNPDSSTVSIAVAKPQVSQGTTINLKKVAVGSNLNINKVADKKIARPGEQITFTLNYSNDGNEAIGNVKIEDALSKYLNVISCSDKCAISDQVLTWNLGALQPKQTGTITVVAQVKSFPAVLGVNSNNTQNTSNDPNLKIDLSESKASISGDNTIVESSVASVAVFDLVAGFQQVQEIVAKEDIVKPVLVRTGATTTVSSQALYLILELSLLGFVYLSLKDRFVKKS